jgi:acyl carrier protein
LAARRRAGPGRPILDIQESLQASGKLQRVVSRGIKQVQSQAGRSMEELGRELKELLIVNLALEDITAEEIEDDEILFGEGLGLDSLDAVEIVVLLQRNYGLEITTEEEARVIFQSMDTLTRWVYENMEK